MKFKCERDIILKEIAIAYDIISSKNILSILSNVLIDAKDNSLTIKATDLKVSLITKIPVEVITPGSTTVFCDKFLGILKSLPSGEVEFEQKDNLILDIKPIFKKIDFNLKSINSDKYPELPDILDENYFEFQQKEIIEMISNTIFAVSNDETRYFMSGVFFERTNDNINMVASDGKRLSFISKKLNNSIENLKDVIIPTKILTLLKKNVTRRRKCILLYNR